MNVQELKGKKILIVGFAREGRDTLRFLRTRLPNQVIGIVDEKESLPNLPTKKVQLHLGKDYLKATKNYDVIIRSPGVPLKKVKPYLSKKHQLTSETDIFFSGCQGTIVGVTGTKGKSTTASLINDILQKGGKKVQLVGNIGKPALQYLSKQTADTIFVFELSSFQLEGMKQSPHVAVFLNLYQEHLDHHGSFENYKKAKANITFHQRSSDFLLYNKRDKNILSMVKKSKAQKIPFTKSKADKESMFAASIQPAVLVGKLFGIPAKDIKRALKGFEPLPHRLEYLGEYKGIRFINDSLATIPEAAIAALDLTGKQATTLIAGGYDRGVAVAPLVKRIEESSLETLILFPDTGEKILKALRKKPKNVFEVSSMKEAVQLAYKHTRKGKTCLLSPAASSFNLFKDYEDRGEQFRTYVKRYGK